MSVSWDEIVNTTLKSRAPQLAANVMANDVLFRRLAASHAILMASSPLYPIMEATDYWDEFEEDD